MFQIEPCEDGLLVRTYRKQQSNSCASFALIDPVF